MKNESFIQKKIFGSLRLNWTQSEPLRIELLIKSKVSVIGTQKMPESPKKWTEPK